MEGADVQAERGAEQQLAAAEHVPPPARDGGQGARVRAQGTPRRSEGAGGAQGGHADGGDGRDTPPRAAVPPVSVGGGQAGGGAARADAHQVDRG
eukprot:2506555-Prymnesium_polylepis.1